MYFIGLCLLLVASEVVAHYVVPPARLQPALYPEWAHYHWVWLSADRASQGTMMQYAQEYLDHGINVGAVDIDSGWSTGFNNFIFNTNKYYNATEMVDFFHSLGIKVILWTTSMIDTDSSNFQEAYDNKYLVRDVLDKQILFSWWHGKGGLLDYTNPNALQWWHQQMDKALEYKIDGWKCDGTDPYILEAVVARGKGGVITRREYSDSYYGDFFDYTRKIRGNDTLIMSRPVDGFGPFYLDFSPLRVMYSGWVGDNDPTFEGMEYALKCYLQSAWANYANFGSDIGGYRSGSGELGRTKQLLIRWAQLGAFSPLMENGGDKEHRPWKFDNTNETLDIYTKFVDVHYQLVPYLQTTGSEAMESQSSSITPLAKHDSFLDKLIDDFKPPTYNYLLGQHILVAPIVTNESRVEVVFPSGSDWVYWWNHSEVYTGGSSHTFIDVPLDEFTVFFKNGSFLPLRVTEKTPFFGESGFSGYIMWLLYPSQFFSASSSLHSFHLREFNGGGMLASYKWSTFHCLEIEISAHPSEQCVVELSRLPAAPLAVLSTAADGEVITLPRVFSALQLRNSQQAYMLLPGADREQVYKALVWPGNSKQGHALKIFFA